MINNQQLKIFTGKKHRTLAEEIAKNLKVELGKTFFKEFSEGEFITHQAETVRDCDVVLIFQVEMSPDQLYKDVFESLQLIRAFREGSASKIRVIYPLIPFSRQDRASKQREFSSFKLLCDLIFTAGADEVYTLHLHNVATTGFFGEIGSKAKMENATLNDFFCELLTEEFNKDRSKKNKMGAPDISAGKSARSFAKRFNIGTVIVDKDRKPNDSLTTVMEVIGDPKGYNTYLFDDMIATAGSCTNAADALREKGAEDIYMLAAHLVYSENTWENLKNANFKEIWITDTCPIPKDKILPNMKIFSVAKLIARIIDNAHNGKSVSDIWNNGITE